uniref:Cytochrome p450 n=1 Tax=Sipha flava TaxID=143950 RepID=A0A2S2Q055_9HEMI
MDIVMELTSWIRSKSIVCAVIFSVITVLWWFHYKWNRRDINRFAAKLKGPPSYPIIGSGLEFIGTSQQVIENLIKLGDKYGPEPFKIWMGTSFSIFIINPEDLQIILNSSKALQKGSFYKFLKNLIGEGLLSAPVDKWRVHRRLISPVFNANLLNQFLPVFHQKNKVLIEKLSKEIDKTQPFDLWEYIGPTTLDTICQNMMGYNLETQLSDKFEFFDTILKASELDVMRIFKPWLHPNIIFTIYRKLTGLQNIYKTLNKLPNKVIKEKKEIYIQRKITSKTNGLDDSTYGDIKKPSKGFLDTLLELNEVGANLTDIEVRDEVVTMMSAGSDTSAVTICFCLLLLAIQPDIQDKVYDEIYSIMGDGDESITIEDTNKLVYLEQVIKETLRLFPVAPMFLRVLQDDVKIVSCPDVVPKGTTCILAPLYTHHIPELYPNPWSFKPENFNPENVEKRHKYSFIPFSSGPRNCLGSKYAMLSMKILISTFLQNFSVYTDTKISDIKFKLDLLMRSANGYPVTIRRRDRRPTYKRN